MIRVRRTHDLDLVEALDRDVFVYDDAIDPDGFWWVATVDGEPAGFAGYKSLAYTGYRPVAYLHRAGVLAEYRGLGLHGRLLSARLRHAKRAGHAVALTYTTAMNPSSVNNLVDVGFRQYLPEYPWGGEEMLYWRKSL